MLYVNVNAPFFANVRHGQDYVLHMSCILSDPYLRVENIPDPYPASLEKSRHKKVKAHANMVALLQASSGSENVFPVFSKKLRIVPHFPVSRTYLYQTVA